MQQKSGDLQDNFFASFVLGWVITNGACIASYPMMMTSGEAVMYKSSLDAFAQILKNEGVKRVLVQTFYHDYMGASLFSSIAQILKNEGAKRVQVQTFYHDYMGASLFSSIVI
ncbi:PREDICTED: ADP,ATP carrier protein 1, mitochondrial-like [Ipomoea nil]|uniref:ADP,ATP carrier protein 1, mitochondrial-like n=1 Tax=Ipomoea nil TaxID=35883 RepID=UPI000900A033|nr:PREDICTED: ADP,ATP carrier protein 1, mitochondrial-like [Ipomoea nil]